ncbi:MAG: Ig-like domain-containing protein, partial [Planctomycetota bacterium]
NKLLVAGRQALVADSDAGLQIVNLIAPDVAGVAPSASIESIVDADHDAPGTQIFASEAIEVIANAADDVKVQKVELWMGGRVVAADLTFPFQLAARVPRSFAGETLPITVRATDTGGNQIVSEPVEITIVENPDATRPTIEFTTLGDNDFIPADAPHRVEIRFSEPLQPGSLSPDHFVFEDSDGQTVTLNDFERVSDNRVILDLPALSAGLYNFKISGNEILDAAGNSFADGVVTFSFESLAADVFWVGPAGGNPLEGSNWSTGSAPTSAQTVFLPTDDLELGDFSGVSFQTLINRSNIDAISGAGHVINGPTGRVELRNIDRTIGRVTNHGQWVFNVSRSTSRNTTTITESLVNSASGTITVRPMNNLIIPGSVRIHAPTINNIGTVRLDAALRLDDPATTLTNAGSILANIDASTFDRMELINDRGRFGGSGRINLHDVDVTLETDTTIADTMILFFDTESTISGNGALNIEPNAAIGLRGIVNVPIVSDGTIFVRENVATANAPITINESGTLNIRAFISLGNGQLTANAGITNHGHIELGGTNTNSDAILQLNNTPLVSTKTGTIEMLQAENAGVQKRIRGDIANHGTFIVHRQGRFDHEGTTFTNTGTLTVLDDRIDFMGTTLINDGGSLNGAGRVNLADATLDIVTDTRIDETLTVFQEPDSTINGPGTLTITSDATLGLRGNVNAPLEIAGTVFVRESMATTNAPVTVTETGLLNLSAFITLGNAQLTAAAGITNAGRIEMTGSNTSNDAILVLENQPLVNELGGRFELQPGGNTGNHKRLQGDIINHGTMIVQRSSSLDRVGSTLTNTGTLTVQDGPFVLSGAGTRLINSGTITVAAGERLETPSLLQITGTTDIQGILESDTPLRIDGGIVMGTGTIDAAVHNNAGTLLPGDTIGTLRITGDYAQNANASLTIDITGLDSGTQHDVLRIDGTANLSGFLNLLRPPTYSPESGDRYEILTAANIGGSFDTITGTDLENGQRWMLLVSVNGVNVNTMV